jgi:hypothetical protein
MPILALAMAIVWGKEKWDSLNFDKVTQVVAS